MAAGLAMVDANGNVQITDIPGGITAAALFHLATNTAARDAFFSQATTDTDGLSAVIRKARGTIASPTVITSGDQLGSLLFAGYSGAGGYVNGAAIRAISEGTIATTRVPAYLSFYTGTDAAPTVLTERMRIDKAGVITFLNYGAGLLHSSAGGVLTSSAIVNADVDAAAAIAATKIAVGTFAGSGLTRLPGALALSGIAAPTIETRDLTIAAAGTATVLVAGSTNYGFSMMTERLSYGGFGLFGLLSTSNPTLISSAGLSGLAWAASDAGTAVRVFVTGGVLTIRNSMASSVQLRIVNVTA